MLNGMMRRYLCVYFPNWPLTRLKRAATGTHQEIPTSTPFALTESGAHGVKIVAVNRAAHSRGVVIGQGLRDALAFSPNLSTKPIDRAANAKALADLARWMLRVSPLVGVYEKDALMLDITGCVHLWDGEKSMLETIGARLKTADLCPHSVAIASTALAASACARVKTGMILPNQAEREGLKGLPVAVLGFGVETLTLLRRFGLTRIGQLYGFDRQALARRFRSKSTANDVLSRLDEALGLKQTVFKPFLAPADFMARLNCPDPIINVKAVETGLTHLAQTVCAQLEATGQGARHFVLRIFRADGGFSQVKIRVTLPTRTPTHIGHLFRDKLAQIDLGFGADYLMLEARNIGPVSAAPPAMHRTLAHSADDSITFARLADRIIARLGPGTVKVFVTHPRHLPEYASDLIPFKGRFPSDTVPNRATNRRASSGQSSTITPPHQGPRPLRFLVRPEAVRVLAEVPDAPPNIGIWRRVVHRVARADGPERINPEWWLSLPDAVPTPAEYCHSPSSLSSKIEDSEFHKKIYGDLVPAAHPRARDYYRIENKDGQRFWLYREGLYHDGRGPTPQWYIQGIFA